MIQWQRQISVWDNQIFLLNQTCNLLFSIWARTSINRILTYIVINCHSIKKTNYLGGGIRHWDTILCCVLTNGYFTDFLFEFFFEHCDHVKKNKCFRNFADEKRKMSEIWKSSRHAHHFTYFTFLVCISTTNCPMVDSQTFDTCRSKFAHIDVTKLAITKNKIQRIRIVLHQSMSNWCPGRSAKQVVLDSGQWRIQDLTKGGANLPKRAALAGS